MSDIASAIKSEIVRLSRKEARAQIEPLKKSLAQAKAQVTALREEVGALKTQIRTMAKLTNRLAETPTAEPKEASRQRFTARGLTNLRERLDLSFDDMGLLLNASDQSIRKWEGGKAVPREKSQQAYLALRGIGKREVAARLEAIKQTKG